MHSLHLPAIHLPTEQITDPTSCSRRGTSKCQHALSTAAWALLKLAHCCDARKPASYPSSERNFLYLFFAWEVEEWTDLQNYGGFNWTADKCWRSNSYCHVRRAQWHLPVASSDVTSVFKSFLKARILFLKVLKARILQYIPFFPSFFFFLYIFLFFLLFSFNLSSLPSLFPSFLSFLPPFFLSFFLIKEDEEEIQGKEISKSNCVGLF